jgi:hypothetical protein
VEIFHTSPLNLSSFPIWIAAMKSLFTQKDDRKFPLIVNL